METCESMAMDYQNATSGSILTASDGREHADKQHGVNQPLQVLIVEDSENDAALLEIELERAGYQPYCHRVETKDEMSSELQRQKWDLVIADYVMTRFNGLDALALVKSKDLDLPF